MTRLQLEHIIRVVGAIADDDDIIVIGSQSILGQFPAAPDEFLVSREADVYPRSHPERADLIDGSIGEGSPFENVYGYYAHGVGPETAVLPAGWEGRLVGDWVRRHWIQRLIYWRRRGLAVVLEGEDKSHGRRHRVRSRRRKGVGSKFVRGYWRRRRQGGARMRWIA